MRYQIVRSDDDISDPMSIEELRALFLEEELNPGTLVISDETIEAIPASVLLSAPDDDLPPPVQPSQLHTLFVVDDERGTFGPYCEETIRLMAAQGYFSFKARAGTMRNSDRWPLYKLLTVGLNFRESIDMLIMNRRHLFVGQLLGYVFTLCSVPSWLVAFAGHADAAAIASFLMVMGIYFAARTSPL